MRLKRSATVCFFVGIFQLTNDLYETNKLENSLVAEAVRRSTSKLSETASISEIKEYLSGYSGTSLTGLLANIKGIYHELVFANAENYDADSLSARVFEETNHPGADIEFISDGEVIQQVQLKAVMNRDIILEHFEKYPDIPIFATSEVAAQFENVSDSGFTNHQLKEDVSAFAAEFGISDTLSKAGGGFLFGSTASLIWTIAEAVKQGRISKADISSAVKDGTISAAFAAAVDFMLS